MVSIRRIDIAYSTTEEYKLWHSSTSLSTNSRPTVPNATNRRISTRFGNPHWMKHGISAQRDLRKSGLRSRRAGNLRCHLQWFRRAARQRLVDPATTAHGKLPCVVEYIGYGGGRVSRSTGCCGPAPAMLTSSWIRAAGQLLVRRRYTRSLCRWRQCAFPWQHDQGNP